MPGDLMNRLFSRRISKTDPEKAEVPEAINIRTVSNNTFPAQPTEILKKEDGDDTPDEDEQINDDEDVLQELQEDGDEDFDHDADEIDDLPTTSHRGLSIQRTFTTFSTFLLDGTHEPPAWWIKFKTLFQPTLSAYDDYIPNYRYAPIFSGVFIPFAILLEIPGVTDKWYVKTQGNTIQETQANPKLLDVGLAVSMVSAVIANACLVQRFLEKRVKVATIACIIFLTIHDLINIAAVTWFGVIHRFDDGFTYGQAFWMTLCSTITSTMTNLSLVYDLIRTPEFSKSGSGLTRKQRSLMVIIILLLCYMALGALISSFVLQLSFVDALYFTVCTIETIGFGDIHPVTTEARIVISTYAVFGIINLALAVALTRESILEAVELGSRKRLERMKIRRREARLRRRVESRWMEAVEWRLREAQAPMWVLDEGADPPLMTQVGRWLVSIPQAILRLGKDNAHMYSYGQHPRGMHLNLEALDVHQLEAAALEAGVPLESLLPPGFQLPNPNDDRESTNSGGLYSPFHAIHAGITNYFWGSDREDSTNPGADGACDLDPTGPIPLTHARLGRMVGMIGSFGMAVYDSGAGGDPSSSRSVRSRASRASRASRSRSRSRSPYSGSRARSPAGRSIASALHGTSFSEDIVSKNVGERTSTAADLNIAIADGVAYAGITTGRTLVNPPQRSQSNLEEPEGKQTRFEPMPRAFLPRLKSHIATQYGNRNALMRKEEKKAFYVRLSIAWTLFIVFWTVGSAIFATTEADWTYGDAMYFCFVAFTTIGYGDYSPLSPSGRAIFVVWALLGVGTMTILISVVSEAFSSRYKYALHTHVFDKAVRRYRQRHHLKDSPPPTLPAGASSKSDLDLTLDADAKVRQRLEELPHQIIQQVRTFHEEVQYFLGPARGKFGRRGGKRTLAMMPDGLKKLLHDVVDAEKVGARIKEEIIQDEAARETLFTLTIEEALKAMVDIAEQALIAIDERDQLLAANENHIYKHQHDASGISMDFKYQYDAYQESRRVGEGSSTPGKRHHPPS